MKSHLGSTLVRGLAAAVAIAIAPLACGSSGGAEGEGSEPPGEATTEASSGSCPVVIAIPSQNEAVGPEIQLSVTQTCPGWTSAMRAYIDSVDCGSSGYAVPNAGCDTTGGAQNFASSTWVKVTPGKHMLTVNNWNASGSVSVSSPVTFTYTAPSGLTVTSPASGASVSDPVTVSASANETVAINQMQLWDDGTKLGYWCNAGQNSSGGCNPSTSTTMSLKVSLSSLASGSNALTVMDIDESYNVIHKATVDFTVTSGSGSSSGGGSDGGTDGGSGSTTDPVLIGAGDIAYGGGGAAATGKELQTLLGANPGAMVFTLGDNAYGNSTCDEGGSPTDFDKNYTPTDWYSLIGKTLPTPGNHEYNNCDLSNTVGACAPQNNCGGLDGSSWVMNGYWKYFDGHAAVTPGGGTASTLHYSYDFVTKGGKKWHYVSLDSGMCFYTDNCSKGSSEYSWLANDLAAHTKASYNGGAYAGIIIGTHIDRWDSAGCPGGSGWMGDMFDLAYGYKVDLWLDGHVHGYERFAQIGQGCQSGETASGCGTFCGPKVDTSGPVLIDLGSGGADDWSGVSKHPLPGSITRIPSTYAVGRIRMHDASWDFTLYDTSNNVIDGPVSYAVH